MLFRYNRIWRLILNTQCHPPPPPYNGNVGQPPLSPLKGSSKLRGSVLYSIGLVALQKGVKREIYLDLRADYGRESRRIVDHTVYSIALHPISHLLL